MVAYKGVLKYIRSCTKHEHKVGTALIGRFLGEIKIVQMVPRLLIGKIFVLTVVIKGPRSVSSICLSPPTLPLSGQAAFGFAVHLV